jgi:hypothetical protein
VHNWQTREGSRSSGAQGGQENDGTEARVRLAIQRRALQRKAEGRPSGSDPEAALEAADESAGTHADPATRKRVESVTGADLSGVRVHTGGASESAARSVGAKAYTVGQDIHFGAGHYQPGTKQGDRLLAHELAHAAQQGPGGKARQNKPEVSEPGDAAEDEADHIADRAMSGGGKLGVKSHGPMLARDPEGGAEKKPDDKQAKKDDADKSPSKDKTAPIVSQFGVAWDSAVGKVAHVLACERLGHPATDKEKHEAAAAVNELSEEDFSLMLTSLQKLGWLEEYLKDIGKDDAKETVGNMAVEFAVPAVGFPGTTKDKVDKHYSDGNAIFQDYDMKVTQPSFTAVGDSEKEKKDGKDAKGLLGNDKGTFNEADLDKDGAEVDKVIDAFINPGMVTAFFFSDLIEDQKTYGKNRKLNGQAVREKGAPKHKGKEAVFMDINGAPNTFVHELGHIIGGKGDEAEHNKGADGKPASGDKDNVMFQSAIHGKAQNKLTPAQLQAFKTGIYAKISKVKPPVGDFEPPKMPEGTALA